MPQPIRRLLVLDAYNLIFRAFYAIPPLTASDGTPTNAVLGVGNMVLKLIEQFRPDAIAVAVDPPGKSFRHEAYEDYKAQRRPAPEELKAQIPHVLDLLRALNYPLISCTGFEADDVIGALARLSEEEGVEALLVSGDRDVLQLVGGGVCAVTTDRQMKQPIVLDERAVVDKLGVRPDQVADLKALAGDTSDNIPGLKGIGEKRALALLSWADHIEEMLDDPERIEDPKLREKVVASADELRRWKDLCTIRTDAPVDVRLEDLRMRDPDTDALRAILSRLQLARLADRILGEAAPREEVAWRMASTAADSAGAAQAARRAGRCTVHAALRGSDIIGLALAVEGEAPWYFPLGSGKMSLFEEAPASLPGPIADVLADAGVRKDCYDTKATQRALRRMGIEARGFQFDALLAAYLLSFGEGGLGVPRLAQRYLGATIGEGLSPADVCLAAKTVGMLVSPLQEGLERERLVPLFSDVEMPLARILAGMEDRGFCVDTGALRELSLWLAARMAEEESAVYELAGEAFTINSPKQLQTILFEKLKLPAGRKTKTGYSTDADVLAEIEDQHPIVRRILDYRAYAKLKSTYAEALARLADSDRRVHTQFNQALTSTGRLSSSEPNLQNIPGRTDLGRKVRRCFVASGDDLCLLACDYSQIELRILAHFSEDDELCGAFREGADIHTRTSALVFGVPEAEVTKPMRDQAKAVNFGIIYGIGAAALAKSIGTSKAEAQEFMDRYFRTYEGVRHFIDATIALAKETGFVTTLVGRKRALPELSSPRVEVRRFGERAAMNTPIQGTAADMIKIAMIDVDRALVDSPDVRMILQVHDELLFELPRGRVPEMGPVICERMARALPLCVPVVVDAKWGANWGEMEPLPSG